MDDVIWIEPQPSDGGHHEASLTPRQGFIAYVRLDMMAAAYEREKQAGAERRKK
jgi:hypothetical protein